MGTEMDFETRMEKDVYRNRFDRLRAEKEEINRTIKLKEQEIRLLKQEDEFKNRLQIATREGEIKALKESKGIIDNYLLDLKGQLHQTNLVIEADKAEGKGIMKLEDGTLYKGLWENNFLVKSE